MILGILFIIAAIALVVGYYNQDILIKAFGKKLKKQNKKSTTTEIIKEQIEAKIKNLKYPSNIPKVIVAVIGMIIALSVGWIVLVNVTEQLNTTANVTQSGTPIPTFGFGLTSLAIIVSIAVGMVLFIQHNFD